MVGRQHPRDEVPERVAENDRGGAAKLFNDDRNVVGQVFHRDVLHRSRRAGDPAGLWAQDAVAGRGKQGGQSVKVLTAASPVGGQHDNIAPPRCQNVVRRHRYRAGPALS